MSENFGDKPKWWHLLFMMALSLVFLHSVFLDGLEYKYVLIDELTFARTTVGVLVGFLLLPILLFAIPLIFKRLMNPGYENSERVMKIMKIAVILCGIGLFTPILVGPLNSHYMKSKGYEKCKPENTTTFTSTLNQYWAKPEIGCGVWNLNHKERQVIKEEILNTQSN